MTALEEYQRFIKRTVMKLDTTTIAQTEALMLADRALESLKCCGNCLSRLGTLCAEDPDCGYHFAPDHCHFAPSRWKEREP